MEIAERVFQCVNFGVALLKIEEWKMKSWNDGIIRSNGMIFKNSLHFLIIFFLSFLLISFNFIKLKLFVGKNKISFWYFFHFFLLRSWIFYWIFLFNKSFYSKTLDVGKICALAKEKRLFRMLNENISWIFHRFSSEWVFCSYFL